jgi:hypothetical protein
MKIRKGTAFGLILAFWAIMVAVPYSARAAETADVTESSISPWAREGVRAAYEAGLVERTFDLGGDYSQFITRLQLARLTVDFVAAEKNVSVESLAEELELVFEVPESAEPEADEAESVEQQAELPELDEGSFPDTRSPYAELAFKLDLMKGSDGLFRPDGLVTRAEAAAVLQRCMAALGVTEANDVPMRFADAYAIPAGRRSLSSLSPGGRTAAGRLL